MRRILQGAGNYDPQHRVRHHNRGWGTVHVSRHRVGQCPSDLTIWHVHHRRRHTLNSWCSSVWVLVRPHLARCLAAIQPRRYLRDGHYDRKCTPVVVELCIARLGLVKVPGSKCTMHCIPGPIGQPLEGLLITALHFNTRLMANWMQLEVPEVRAALSAGHTHRICACGLCGAWSDPRTQLWNQWRKSGKGLYYHPRCYARITAAQRQLF